MCCAAECIGGTVVALETPVVDPTAVAILDVSPTVHVYGNSTRARVSVQECFKCLPFNLKCIEMLTQDEFVNSVPCSYFFLNSLLL